MTWLDGLGNRKIVLLLVLAGSLAFANSLGGRFVVDDTDQIVANRDVRSWSNLGRAFTTHVWAFRERGNFLRVPVPPPYYRPLFTVALTIEYHLFGLWPQGWHLCSLLLHMACSVSLFLVLLLMLGRRSISAVSAFMFTVFPGHAESVSWISGMTDPLFGFFFLISLYCYMRHLANGRPLMLLASTAAFALSALSKETALSLIPFIIAFELIEHFKSGPRQHGRANIGAGTLAVQAKGAAVWGRAAVRLAPFALVTVVYLAARYAVLGGFSWVNPHAHNGPFLDTLMTLPLILVTYAEHIIWPVNLSAAYHTHFVTTASSPEFWLPTGVLIVLGLAILAYRSRISRAAMIGAALLAAPLIPVLDLGALSEDYLVSDRYLYLPVAGACLLAVLAIDQAAHFIAKRAPGTVEEHSSGSARSRLTAAACAAMALAGLAGCYRENRPWADSLTLWSRAASVRPDFWAAQYNVGLILVDESRFSESLEWLQRAANLAPREPAIYDATGRAYAGLGQPEQAVTAFERAISLDHAFFESLNNLGTVYFKAGDYRRAEACFVEAVAAKPAAFDSRYNLALCYAKESRYPESIREFETVLKAVPMDAEAQYELGLAYEGAGRLEDAARVLNQCQKLATTEELKQRAFAEMGKLTQDFDHNRSGGAVVNADR